MCPRRSGLVLNYWGHWIDGFLDFEYLDMAEMEPASAMIQPTGYGRMRSAHQME